MIRRIALAVLFGICFNVGLTALAGEAEPAPAPAPAPCPPSGAAAPAPAPAPEATPPAPLMKALDDAGLAGPLKAANVNIYGYIEGGYMYDFSQPHNSQGHAFIGYNSFKDTGVLDKISLNVERTVDPTKKTLDVGFKVEGLYGADAAFIHSDGLCDRQTTGRYQFDLTQAYIDLAFPGVPMKLRMGKWIELAGYENFDSNIYGAFSDPSKALYSFSDQFLYAEPGTQTGAYATWVLNPKFTMDAGFTLGWNQSVIDRSGGVDFLGRATYTPDEKTSVVFVMTEGPEFPPLAGKHLPDGDRTDPWTALDLVVTRKLTDKLSLGWGFDYVFTKNIPGVPGANQQWGGVCDYVSYALDSHFTLNSRAEYYRDNAQGFSTGAASSVSYYETTLGVAVKPLPQSTLGSHLLIRPEVRYDHADHAVIGNGYRNQLTFSVGGLFTF